MKKISTGIWFTAITCGIMAALYLIGIADLDYGYYTFLRVFSMIVLPIVVFTYMASSEKVNTIVTYAPAVIWILFNPIFPIYLDKEIWVVLDLICGAAMIVCGIYALVSKKD